MTDSDRAATPASYSSSDIRHMALRNAIYHAARMRVLDRRNRVVNFATLVLGTAVASDVGKRLFSDDASSVVLGGLIAIKKMSGGDLSTLLLGGLVAMLSAAQLVFDFAGLARTHQTLARDYQRLLTELLKVDDASADQCRTWTARIVDIGIDAPPLFRALDAVADNEASDTLGYGEDDLIQVSTWQRITKHWYSWPGYHFRRMSEVKATEGRSH